MKTKSCLSQKSYSIVILVLFVLMQSGTAQSPDSSKKNWFPLYNFNPEKFKSPPQEFSPYARWWWPGNDVTKEELKREINLFADNTFGGVEIQPMSLLVPRSSDESYSRVLGWDTPEYYENVKTVMEEARKRGIIVDMTNGSGWPTGGSYLLPEDGFINLLFATADIKGANKVAIPVPAIVNRTGVPSRLEAVLATKVLSGKPDNKTKTISLDPNSTLVITGYVKNDTILWSAPSGEWKIIAFWSKPNSLFGSMTASPKQGPVLNHFDSLKVIKNYNYLFGPRTGLQPYFGNPMRAIFTDSYEFEVDRHYSIDFIQFFKMKRGYDITPWLPANMQKGYNYASWKNPNAQPDFSFGEIDSRLRYDYDMTLSELFEEHFIKASRNWTEKRNLLFRTQAYGLNLDLIANAGHASIPETETMVGPEAILKVMSSGAHLYNRPIVSSESVVFINRAYMTTPQKIRLIVDKLFAAGVNQIIYHGVPYRYITKEILPIGWYPFCASFMNFSSNLGEGNIFWKYQKEINEYISRTQYALRSGKPHTDVLIYFPFMNVEGMPDNPEEILTKGYIEGAEPPLPAGEDLHLTEKGKWAEKFYPVINQLELAGITWEWVNDISIQQAQMDGKQINIRGNRYQALILIDASNIAVETSKRISLLAKNGMNFLAVGILPSKQPSFFNWEINDKVTEKSISDALGQKNSKHISDVKEMALWIDMLNVPVKFNGHYTFTRQIQRDMNDGSRIQFIWNKSNEWQPISFILDKKYKHGWWLNAENGAINQVSDIKNTSYVLPPFSTIILYAGTKTSISDNYLSRQGPTSYQAKEILKIEKWDLIADSISIKNNMLFNWRDNERLKFSSSEGIYKSSFHLDEITPETAYFIDLGKVYFTADLIINGKPAGKRLYAPYSLNITDFIKKGDNTVEVHITTGQLNDFIGEAARGDRRFDAFKGKQDNLMSAGLVGPVYILKH